MAKPDKLKENVRLIDRSSKTLRYYHIMERVLAMPLEKKKRL